ncbi:chromate efflux transporter [Flavobacterium frigoris]|uniref:Chromate transporter n=1 Tax=Flavobacterium frigoris TaxID=229204 RepID=A0A1H9KJ80_FLAFI|nr:chromate efflux transporter [Flavobacterium frigoris]SEQ99210.1 chromate transporter [Flavobacterium frigoris]
MNEKQKLKEVAALFLKLGIIGFGGPAAHISMMREEVVVKKKWLEEQHFLDLIGATNLIPGPNSTEMAIHIGHERAGWKGLIVAGMCFIVPAVILTGIFAWLYKEYGQLPEIQPFLYGIKPAIIAIILGAIFPLAKKSLKTIRLGVIGSIILLLSLLQFNEIALLFGAGFLALFWNSLTEPNSNVKGNSWISLTLVPVSKTALLAPTNFNLFLIFLKIGAILYGSGYVLFAFLDAELVAKGLLTRTQLIDAIAVGQFTPGPVFSSVTFVGYQINGISGALIATLAIFLPSFVFVALLNPLVKKMRNSKSFAVFLDAVNVASIAIIVSICYELGKETITDWRTILIAIVSVVIVFNYKKVNSAIIVLGGAVLGYLLTLGIFDYFV